MTTNDAPANDPIDQAITSIDTEAEPRNVVIPLDGSRRATRALLPARRFSAALGLPLGAITVAEDRPRIERAELESIRAANRMQWSDVVLSSNAAEGINACAIEHDAIVVMATGARSRSAAIVGSTAASVVGNSKWPVVLVGPGTEVSERRPIVELVVAVSGTASGESICGPAVSLAEASGFGVHFVTVVQPTLEPANPQTSWDRRFGPPGDEHAYMADLVSRHQTPGVRITGSAISDPISPASGLAQMMRHRPQAVLVLGTTSRTGMARFRHGSVASRIVNQSPTPAIMIPTTPDRRDPVADVRLSSAG